MKKITLSLLTLGMASIALPATAADLMIAATMQRCNTNDECALVTNSCADNCGFVPVNKSNLPALQQMYQARCGKPIEANPTCNMNPPIAAACINSRCTIDYAFANNAGAKDYQAGAYGVPPAAVANQVPGDYSKVNDRNGAFTAYDLPKTAIKQDTVGTITTKIYVPPSAPVTGGNYVPVTGMVPSAPATAVVPSTPVTAPSPSGSYVPSAPTQAPVPVPAPATYVPPAPVPAPAPAIAPTPAGIPPLAVPTSHTYATPPVMTPSKPNQLPPMAAPVSAPEVPASPAPVPAPTTYVPAPTTPTIPTPGLPRAPTAYVPSAPVAAPAVPSVGATGIPQAPAGSIPIPPSDLKPAPTFVPPAGAAIPVSPEDPGALPPPGTTLGAPQNGMLTTTTTTTASPYDITPPPPGTVDATVTTKKSFGGTTTKKTTYITN